MNEMLGEMAEDPAESFFSVLADDMPFDIYDEVTDLTTWNWNHFDEVNVQDLIEAPPRNIEDEGERVESLILDGCNVRNEQNPHFPLYLADDDNFQSTIFTNDFGADVNFRIAEGLYRTRLAPHRLARLIREQPVNTRTLTSLKGWPLGQMIECLRSFGVRNLDGYYFCGTIVNFHNIVGDAQITGTVTGERHVERLQIAEFPLAKIVQTNYVRNSQADNYFEMLDEYLLNIFNDAGGSSVSVFMCWEQCSIVRRSKTAAFLKQKVYATVTGNIGHILIQDVLLSTRGNHMSARFADQEFSLYLPKGHGDCIQKSFEFLLKSLDPDEYEGLRRRPCSSFNLGSDKDKYLFVESGEVFNNFIERYSLALLNTTKYRNMDIMSERIVKLKTYIRKKLGNGYSRKMIKELIKDVEKHYWIRIHVYYVAKRRNSKLLYLRDVGETIPPMETHLQNVYAKTVSHFSFFQMTLKDGLYDVTKLDKRENPGILHLIGVQLGREKTTRRGGALLYDVFSGETFGDQVGIESTIKNVNLLLIHHMEKQINRCDYQPDVDESEIETAVTYQLERRSNKQTNSLIFSEQNFAQNVKPPAQKLKAFRFSSMCAVIAFDIETVTNTPECQEDVALPFRWTLPDTTSAPFASRLNGEMTEMGWTTFTRSTIYGEGEGGDGSVEYHREERLNEDDVAFFTNEANFTAESAMTPLEYGPVEAQIPFSVQWVPVNVSDSGEHAARKRKCKVALSNYYSDGNSPHGKIDNEHVECRGDIILSEVQTEYGDFKLGACVEEFMKNAARWGYDRGYKILYCYAHNGSGFDNLIVLKYSRYPVSFILKTSRGVIMMNITVALEEDDPNTHVTLCFRDTRLWLNGSLKNIAAAFNVPKKWQKINFPITLINAKNCYDDTVMRLSKPYGENDILALAWILKFLNASIGDSPWKPCDPYTRKPPVAQFPTVMGMVKKCTFNHFMVTKGLFCNLPCSVDVPMLRNWIKKATMGGRTEAYAKSFISGRFGKIVEAYMKEDKEELKKLYLETLAADDCDIVLDATSLYPTAQSYCPMPTGELYFINKTEAEATIDSIHCETCDREASICAKHRSAEDNRPFSIIIVKDVIMGNTKNCIPLCARKLIKGGGLLYSFESAQEVNERLRSKTFDPAKETQDEREYEKNAFLQTNQSYTNVDLYWMNRLGFTYTVICGMAWKTCKTYASFLLHGFEMRKKAKEAKNSVMSEHLKLTINGAYGVTAQKDIDTQTFLTTLPTEMSRFHYTHPDVLNFLKHNNKSLKMDEEIIDAVQLPSGQTLFKKKKIKSYNDFYSDPSPIQIGAAVLAWARHIMNLVIVNLGKIKYTDTDSIAISNEQYNHLLSHYPRLIDNTKAANLGTFKNDHEESAGVGARVVYSIYGTKKVKMHVTLSVEGEVKIHNTFKGLNPSLLNDEGLNLHTDHFEYETAMSLWNIFNVGTIRPTKVAHWKRSIQDGVKIGSYYQEGSSATYLNRSKGVTFQTKTGEYASLTEWFVPFGSCEIPAFQFIPDTSNPNDKEYCILHNERRLRLLYGKMRMSMSYFGQFLQKYYERRDTVASMEDEEFRKIVITIQAIDKNL